MSWQPMENGATIGTVGSEGGVILRDEEYYGAMRITLEQGGSTAPFAITCGIYGSMCHTVFASSEAEGVVKYGVMKDRLVRLLGLEEAEYYPALERFVDDF